MRLLIVSPKTRLTDSVKFAEALAPLGVNTICVHDEDYYALSDRKVLRHVPFPKLLKLIKRFNPDFTFTFIPYYTVYMAKLLNRPLLVHLRGDIWTEVNYDRAKNPSFSERIFFVWINFVTTHGIEKADLILPVSKWLEKRVKQHLPKHPTHVLYRGVNPEEWLPKPCITPFSLKHPAVVGTFEFRVYPKVVGLLKFIKCIEKMPDVNFYFAGAGPYMNLIERNRPSNMFLLGRLSKSRIQSLLASGDVFVHPSGLDALPRSVVEAALMEKPIIASNVGGIPEIVEDKKTGYLCEIDDTDQWVEQIRFLLNNPSFAEMLARNARKAVSKKFDWKNIAKDFVNKMRLDEWCEGS